MPIVYACICPTASPTDDGSVVDALRRAVDELAGYEPDLVIYIAPAASGATKIGVFANEGTLSERVVAEAKKDAVPVERLMRWTIGEPPVTNESGSRAYIATSGVEPRVHFEFGRAAGRALAGDEQRTAIVCAVELSKGNERFDAQYRRALSAWNVKAMLSMDVPSRRSARERAIPQTALLMGVLGGFRIQPRELGYSTSPAGGHFVAAIDILGRRKIPP